MNYYLPTLATSHFIFNITNTFHENFLICSVIKRFIFFSGLSPYSKYNTFENKRELDKLRGVF